MLIIDATVAPQDIAYPTDLNILNDSREKSEELIDKLYNKTLHQKKPRTYRQKARKLYLRTAQNKKEKDIILKAKPLGRLKAVPIHVSSGERNPIEGKFGQGKTAYGLNLIKARLKPTSETWIASIILVLNLVKLAGLIYFFLKLKIFLLKINENYHLFLNEIFLKKFLLNEKKQFIWGCKVVV